MKENSFGDRRQSRLSCPLFSLDNRLDCRGWLVFCSIFARFLDLPKVGLEVKKTLNVPADEVQTGIIVGELEVTYDPSTDMTLNPWPCSGDGFPKAPSMLKSDLETEINESIIVE